VRRLFVLWIAVLLAGCSNPLATRDDDYGLRAPIERLRSIEPMDMSARASADQGLGADPAANPFAGLERVELSLEECRASALEHNLDLRVALISPTIANESLTAEEARFESVIFARASMAKTDSPTASELSDAQAEFYSLSPGVRVPLRTGGTATVTLPINRSKTNNVFSTLNPAYTTDLQFSISQPLLRNAGRRVATHGIRIASISSQISQAQTRLQVINQLAAVDRAYWRLYQARTELDVRQQQYELAVRQRDRAKRQVEVGRAAEIELIRAEAGVASRLDTIILTHNAVLSAQRELKRLVNMPGLGVGSPTVIVPSSPPDPLRYDLDPGELVGVAMTTRTELLELELQLAADAANIDLARNQRLPVLNVDASYTINGLGGNLSSSAHTLADNDFEDWSVGFSGELPIGNNAAESRLRSAVLSRIQRLSTRESRRQLIRQDVLDAIDAINAGWQRILAARQATVLSARAAEAEQRQFNVGASTTTEVLDAAARLADAQTAEIRAVVDYQNAQTNLALATGMLLGASRIHWEPLDPGGEP
jgi:outer membrane protein TolC